MDVGLNKELSEAGLGYFAVPLDTEEDLHFEGVLELKVVAYGEDARSDVGSVDVTVHCKNVDE